MKEKLSQNLALKALSVVIAFIIWITVVNVSNPETSAYQVLTVEVENADRLTSASKTYSLNTETVRISYRVRSLSQREIRPEDFHAYIDLADYSITGAVPVYIETSDRISHLVSNVSVSPMVIQVDTEDIQRKRFNVVSSTTGKTMDGYVAGEIKTAPDYVYVQGPVSKVGQISDIGIEVDVTEASAVLQGDAPVKFYDANGNEISKDSRITLSRDTIAYTLPVYRIKSLSLTAAASGTPAEGYMLENVSCSPDTVNVYGPEELLKQHSVLHIPETELSVDGASATATRSIDITEYLPEGLSLAQPGTEVTLVARISRIPQINLPAATAESGETLPESQPETDSEVIVESPAQADGGTADSGAAEESQTSEETLTIGDTAEPSEPQGEAPAHTAEETVAQEAPETGTG